ncbi:MAG: 50S ribosomal protein L1 [Endomicrobium sp.]|jgi:large subunit ribosomal protein L1|nr:50S ribosomal protein L1 [Endomicrobium sp.]
MGKRLEEAKKLINEGKVYVLTEAVTLLKKMSKAKFDETVEAHIKLGIDPKKSDQVLRGTLSLPYGVGRVKKIAVLAKGEKQKEAETAGADVVGFSDLIDDISKGNIDFDILVATPDVMRDLSRVAKILGPKGIMPNPKSRTVTFEIAKTVMELKKGRLEYKNDSFGIVHVPVGKISFEEEKLVSNIKTLLETIMRVKPVSSKGQYIKNISISSTMGPGIFIMSKI